MKTFILTALLTALLSIATVFGQDTDKMVLTNIETTEEGSIKEMIYLDKDTHETQTKTVYHFNKEELLLMKVNYTWASREGWQPIQKYEYIYTTEGQPSVITFTQWDKKKEEWANDKTEMMAYIYTKEGDLATVK